MCSFVSNKLINPAVVDFSHNSRVLQNRRRITRFIGLQSAQFKRKELHRLHLRKSGFHTRPLNWVFWMPAFFFEMSYSS